jgi:hypothetical protein
MYMFYVLPPLEVHVKTGADSQLYYSNQNCYTVAFLRDQYTRSAAPPLRSSHSVMLKAAAAASTALAYAYTHYKPIATLAIIFFTGGAALIAAMPALRASSAALPAPAPNSLCRASSPPSMPRFLERRSLS